MAAAETNNDPNVDTSNSHAGVSRICIKNIPPSCNEANLRKHLSTTMKNHNSIVITDCKILRTKDGKSRKLAFVGFQSSGVSSG
jgi:RNA recognition motif-containing protein